MQLKEARVALRELCGAVKKQHILIGRNYYDRCLCGSLKRTYSRGCRKCTGVLRRQSILGNTYGKLFVEKFLYQRGVHGSFWQCKCECGKTKAIRANSLKRGLARSCGLCTPPAPVLCACGTKKSRQARTCRQCSLKEIKTKNASKRSMRWGGNRHDQCACGLIKLARHRICFECAKLAMADRCRNYPGREQYQKLAAIINNIRSLRSSLMEPAPTKAES
jgi:hypothetical protein